MPTGIQRLLRLASVEEAFRKKLIEQRGTIAKAAGVPLSETESKILSAISVRQLEAMIRSMPPLEDDRRSFLRQAAVSAVVLLGGAGLAQATTSCEAKPSANAEDPVQRPNRKDMETEGGAAPHEPPERPEHNDTLRVGGAAPDEPPPRPDQPAPPTGSQPDMPPPRPKHTDTRTKGGSDPSLP